MLRPRWKIALIIDSPAKNIKGEKKLNKMQAHLLALLAEQSNIQISFIIATSKAATPPKSFFQRGLKKFMLSGSELLQASTKTYFSKTRWLELDASGQAEQSEYFERFRRARVDLILSFSEKPLAIEWAQYSRCGLLRAQFGPSLDFSEIAGTEALQSLRLNHIFYRGDQCFQNTLRQGQVRRYFDSVAKHIDAVLTAMTPWWPQAVNENILKQSSQNGRLLNLESLASGQFHWGRRSLQQMGFLAHIFWRKARRLFLFQNWNVAIIRQPLKNLLDPQAKIHREWLPRPSKTRFIADPFPVFHDGQLKIFVENYDFRKAKGSVEAICLETSSESSTRTVVEAIELPTHMSYPSMIVEGDSLYCLPETLGEGEVAIYRCKRYPNHWEKVKTLLANELWSDPTMFQHGGKWWLFATRYDFCSGGNDQLYAWHAEAFLGDWVAHTANPIKLDIASARSAGMPFTVDGKLFRPSQDCSRVYGGAVIMNRIVTLNENEFVEEEVCRWSPDETYPEGCHHIAGYGDLTIIDGRIEEFSLWAPWVKIRQLFRAPVVPAQPLSELEGEVDKKNLDSFKVQTSW